MTVALDLVELDGKATPEAIVDEIFHQNANIPIPVPLEELARLAGVEQIRALESSGFEGMLVANVEKTRAEIFYNPNSNPQRKRFTVGHELGHLLLPHHQQSTYECSKEDMTRFERSPNPRSVQEAEANRFSSELLMPRWYFKKRMKEFGELGLEHIDTLHTECCTSTEATARRYVSLSEYPCAVVFAKDKLVRYFVKNEELSFYLDIKHDLPLPKDSPSCQPGAGVGDWQEVDSWLWLREEEGRTLPSKILEQTLWQDQGYKVILLFLEDVPDGDDN